MSELLETPAEAVKRLQTAHPHWAVWQVTGGDWYAARTGALSAAELDRGALGVLSAADPDGLEALIKVQEQAGWTT